jgi:CDP-diglyceride synthetase
VNGLVGRVLIAAPLIVIAILAVVVGGWPMVALAVAFGMIAMHEYGAATRSLRPLTIAGFAGVAGIIVVTHQGGLVWSLAALMGTLLLAFWLSAVADVRQAATVQLSVTLLGVVWIGYGLAFLVALRDIPAPDAWGKQL